LIQWGSPEKQKLLKQHEENWGVKPSALLDKPELYPQNMVYNRAFNILASGRQNTDNVINPITFSDVMSYCDCIEEFEGYERLRYWEMVNACDVAWMAKVLEMSSTKTEVKKPNIPT
jgi:hypothetical protein